MWSGSSFDFLYGWYDSEFRLNFMSKKFIEVFPIFAAIFSSLSLNMVLSYFLNLSKELPDLDRITASLSSRYYPTLMKSMIFFIYVSMHKPMIS